MKRILAMCLFFSAASAGQAQNLLVNGDLESSPAFTYYDGSVPSVFDDVPGWELLSEGDPSSWVQVAFDSGAGTTDVDLSGSETSGNDPDFVGLSGLRTAPGSRPSVTPSQSYRARVTYDNYFAPAGISYFIDWFDGGGILLSSSGGALADPNGPLGYAPYTQLLEITGSAPATAAKAGVRFESSNGAFAGAAADNFSLSLVPEPGAMALVMLGALAVCGVARRRKTA